MNRYTRQVLPVLMGIAAVLLSAAAVVTIVVQVRGPGTHETVSATTAFSRGAGPTLQEFAQQFGGQLDATYLGVSVTAQQDGLLVRAVVPDSPAAKAGVQTNDVITAVNGTKVTTIAALRKQLDAVGAGKQYTVTVTRNGKSQDLTVQQASVMSAAHDWLQGALGGAGGPGPHFRGFDGPRGGQPSGTPGPQT